MNFDAGKISSTLSLNADPFARGMLRAESLMQVFPQTVTTFMANPLLGVINITKQVSGSLIDLGKSGIKLAADMEQSKIAFEVMLGSASNAKILMDDISRFAASTPFEIPELVGSTRKLIAFGFAQGEVLDQLRRLGDLSAALQIPIGDLADIYGKARVQGRLMMEDINQLSGRGIPITRELARVFGVAESEIRGMVEQGKVGFPQLQQAVANMTGTGGQFAGMMERQSKSLLGLWSTLQDAIGGVERQLGEALVGGGRGAEIVGLLTENVESLQPAILAVGQALGEVMPKLAVFMEWGGRITKDQAKNVAWLLDNGSTGRGASELDQVGQAVTAAGTRDWVRLRELARRYGELGLSMKDALRPMSDNAMLGGMFSTKQASDAQKWMGDLRTSREELVRLQAQLDAAKESGNADAFAATSAEIVREAKKIEAIRDSINDMTAGVLTSGNEALQNQIVKFKLGINDAAQQAKTIRDAILANPERPPAAAGAAPTITTPAEDTAATRAASREETERQRAMDRASEYAFEAEKLRLSRELSASQASIAIFDLETKRKEERIQDLTELWEYQMLRIQQRDAMIAELAAETQIGAGGIGGVFSVQFEGLSAAIDAQVKAAANQMKADASAVTDAASRDRGQAGARQQEADRAFAGGDLAASEVKALRSDLARLHSFLQTDAGQVIRLQLTALQSIDKKTLPIEGEDF